ncbi:ABC transporter permease [Lacticaseibacillus mingshuiensis]|uniref:Transport permease protein n=1 Tax=Lacticaseibacillus mingshuiensis TaxID=2799574 RepID=A0ABW4CFE9_9LACO|nr:ABC transporter permease [Lacticaseibacillus mingshuiensis]
MKSVWIVLKEQFGNLGMIFRISRYDEHAEYQSHYLGLAWEILNPIIQVGVYYLVFGMGLRGNRSVNGVPFIAWMLIGMSAWLFMNTSMNRSSKSITGKLYVISKMQFPVSTLPSVTIVSNLTAYWAMLAVAVFSVLVSGVPITIYWLQFFYYFICMIAFTFAMAIFSATMTVLVRDYQFILQSILRVMLYLSGAIWNLTGSGLPPKLVKFLQLNPIYYVINGYRSAFLSDGLIWENKKATLLFWLITSIILVIGCHLHVKFRARFVDLA